MPIGIYCARYRSHAPQHALLVDDQGNCPEVIIRGVTIAQGDGASAPASGAIAIGVSSSASAVDAISIGTSSAATAVGAVSIGQGVTNAVTNTIAIGANSVKLYTGSVGGAAYFAPAAPAAGAAPTGAQIYGGVYNMNAALTWPTAAAMVAAVPNAQVGDTIQFTVINSTAGALAQAGAGGATVADASWSIDAHGARTFIIRLTNVTGGAEAFTVT